MFGKGKAAVACAIASLGALGSATSAGAQTQTFSNPAPITINDAVTPDVPVAASPSPAVVTLPVLKYEGYSTPPAAVTLHGVSHTSPSDVKVTLVNAFGQMILLENAGGVTTPVVNATITFANRQAVRIPFNGPMTSGVFTPSVYSVTGIVQGSGANALRYTAGAWSVYVADQDPTDTGSVAGGISVTVTGKPRRSFKRGTVKLDRRKGSASFNVSLPNPGTFSLAPSRNTSGMKFDVPAAGDYPIKVSVKGKARAKLKAKGKIRLTLVMDYTPTGGEVKSARRTITFKLKK